MDTLLGPIMVLAGVLTIIRFRSVAAGITRFHRNLASSLPFLYMPLPFFKSPRFWNVVAPLAGLLFLALGLFFLLGKPGAVNK